MALARWSPAIVIAALAPASLLLVDPAGWYPFGPVKWLAITTIVLAGAAVVFARRPVRMAVAPTLAAIALVAALAVGALFGADGLYAWVGTPERHLGVLAWVLAALAFVVGQSLDDGDGRVVGVGLVVAGAGLGLAGVVEALGWEPAVFDVSDRLSGLLGSPAYLGAATALVLPALVGVALDRSWAGWLRATAGRGRGWVDRHAGRFRGPSSLGRAGRGCTPVWLGAAQTHHRIPARRHTGRRRRRRRAGAAGGGRADRRSGRERFRERRARRTRQAR